MNVYEINENNISSLICADTAIEALKYYESITDIGLVYYDITDDIIMVPREEWGEREILDVEGWTEEFGYSILQTVEEYMKTAVNTEIIATSIL